jgi:hypothetical protein
LRKIGIDEKKRSGEVTQYQKKSFPTKKEKGEGQTDSRKIRKG